MGRLAVLLGGILTVVLPMPFWGLNHRDSVFSANLIRHLPHLPIVGRRIVEFIAVPEGYRVNYEMVMIGSNVRLILFLSNTENRPLCYGVVRLAMTGVGSLMRAEICGFPKRNGILYKNKISGGEEMLPLMFYGFSNG